MEKYFLTNTFYIDRYATIKIGSKEATEKISLNV